MVSQGPLRSSARADNSGVQYIKEYSNPQPPYADINDANTDKKKMLGYAILGFLTAWPFLLLVLLVSLPRLFGLPPDNFDVSQVHRGRNFGRAHAKRVRWQCGGVCAGVSILYCGFVIVAIWLIIHFAWTGLTSFMEGITHEDGVGGYVLMTRGGNGSVLTLYSAAGVRVGDLVFKDAATEWSMGVPGEMGLKSVGYNFTSSSTGPLSLTATCGGTNSSNSTGNGTCVTGRLISMPATGKKGYANTDNPVEFGGNFNLTLNITDTTPFNVTSPHATLTAEMTSYQGIGQELPPLGMWYVNSTTIVHVIWSANDTRACAGLRVNISRDYPAFGLIVVGMVWKWWVLWIVQGCN